MKICDFIGNTPLIQIGDYKGNDIYIKMEGCNIFGSAKDRAAYYVLTKLLNEGVINHDTEIIESSSGNMAVALAAVGRQLGIKVRIVLDDAVSGMNEFLVKSYGAAVIRIHEKDENGSYLKARLEAVREYKESHSNVYWFNQYGNPLVREAYQNTVGMEIAKEACTENIDNVFVAISSGGTISGIAAAVRNIHPATKIIAVDVEGSRIFEPETAVHRHFTGIGSSIISDNVRSLKLDDHVIVNEKESIRQLKCLLKEEQIFVGESTGSVLAGIKKYLDENNLTGTRNILVSHDRGERYYEAFYSKNAYENEAFQAD